MESRGSEGSEGPQRRKSDLLLWLAASQFTLLCTLFDLSEFCILGGTVGPCTSGDELLPAPLQDVST